MSPTSTIGIVDDEPGMLKALSRLLRVKGYAVRTFNSADEFLAEFAKPPLDCAVLDVAMPNLDGLALQERLNSRGVRLPILFLTGAGDIPMSVRAMKAGAVTFLTKPVDQTELLNALRLAVREGAHIREEEETVAELRKHFDRLTPREKEVLRHVIAGKLNKQIAADLGVSEQTVKVHRMHIGEKTSLHSVAELVRAAGHLGIEPVE